VTDRQTDRLTMAYSVLCIYAVAHSKWPLMVSYWNSQLNPVLNVWLSIQLAVADDMGAGQNVNSRPESTEQKQTAKFNSRVKPSHPSDGSCLLVIYNVLVTLYPGWMFSRRSFGRRFSQPVSYLVQSTQPSQPVFLLVILTVNNRINKFNPLTPTVAVWEQL